MGADKNSETGQGSSHIEEILEERERLEKLLKEKYRKEVAILFTDICGYTEYIDTRGDISGRALLLKHNRIVLPIIESHGGKVTEIIGDAVMASFPSALQAVKSAVAIQQALQAHNLETEPADRIHVASNPTLEATKSLLPKPFTDRSAEAKTFFAGSARPSR
jgi:class 3 adenylate cyclase